MRYNKINKGSDVGAEINFKPLLKQHTAWNYLMDKTTEHILFGGSAGGGKTVLICYWLLIMCISYPGTRWLLGRSRLLTLKRTTLKSFLDTINKCKLNNHVNYNQQNNVITFHNGSEIMLMDLFPYPGDPDFDRLGSMELTGAAIDELSDITFKAFEVISSRIRYKLKDYNLIPKILCASNPTRSWVYNYFVKPEVDGVQSTHIKFIPALPGDNPHLPIEYVKSLERLDVGLRNRLLYGNWDFMDEDYQLFTYDRINQLFYNEYFNNKDSNNYLTCDVADLGSDRTVIGIWNGWNCVRLEKFKQLDTTAVVSKIREYMGLYRININNVIVDATGVGAGVGSLLKGCIRYMGAERPLNGEKYRNLKAQLMWHFAERVDKLDVCFNFPYDDGLVQEMLVYKKDFKNELYAVSSKDDVRKSLGRSPDMIDALYLRAYWDCKPKAASRPFAVL